MRAGELPNYSQIFDKFTPQ